MRSNLRNITTQAAKRRLLKGLNDDVLIKFLIDSCQDAIDPNVSHYPNEDQDLIELIRELLYRMDAHRTLESLKEQYPDDFERMTNGL